MRSSPKVIVTPVFIFLITAMIAAIWIDGLDGVSRAISLTALSILVNIYIAVALIPKSHSDNTFQDSSNSGRYPIWCDIYYRFWGDGIPHFISASILLALVLFLIGWIFSSLFQFGNIYIHSLPVYLGIMGAVWTTAMLAWWRRRLLPELASVFECFVIEKKDYDSRIDTLDKQLSNPRNLYITISLLISSTVFLTYLSVFHGKSLSFNGMSSFQPTAFPTQWYENQLPWKMFLISYFAVVCCIPLGTAVYYVWTNTNFLFSMRSLNPVSFPQFLVIRFREITRVYLRIAFAFSVGVALLAVLFFNEIDSFSVSVVVLTGMVGSSLFFGPQLIFHHFIVVSYRDLAKAAIRDYEDMVGPYPLSESPANSSDTTSRIVGLSELLTQGELWVFELRDIAILAAGQMISLSLVFLKSLL